jgi:hypothetical protein
VTEGQTATFGVAATSSGAVTYQWKRDGVDIGGATAATYTTPATVLGDDGAAFTCAVTNAAGTTTSNPATLTVNKVPDPVLPFAGGCAAPLRGGEAAAPILPAVLAGLLCWLLRRRARRVA